MLHDKCGSTRLTADSVVLPRRCPARVLEDVGSAVALLVGELSRKTQRITRAEAEADLLRKDLQIVREDLTLRDSR